MRLFDLHCDTALSLYQTACPLRHNDLHISLERSYSFEKYVQLMAIYTPQSLSNGDGWEQFHRVHDNLMNECEKNGIPIVKTAAELEEFEASERHAAFIITVEDARILCGKTERLTEMYELGIRVITPMWGGETILGGSHNTSLGLSNFGREAVCEMLRLGIIPDISHASFASADKIMDICETAGKRPIATHMNSYSVCAHSRNLTDDRYLRLIRLGGIAGVSLCPYHLTAEHEHASANDVLRHIQHYSSLARGHVSFGCDYDGTETPDDVSEISRLSYMADVMKHSGMAEDEINGVFWSSAYEFMKNALPA